MKKKQIIYDVIFSILALIAIVITILDILNKIDLDNNYTLYSIDQFILYIFIIDYFGRLIFSKNKKEFFKNNIPDLISIIPFHSIFKIFRITKLLRITKLTRLTKLTKLFRFIGISGRLYKYTKRFLKKNGLIYVLGFNIILIFLGAIAMTILENYKFEDAIWWAFVTATTVGYGDISPTSLTGRILAGLLMIVGIGSIGMLTGSIATFFLSENNNLNNDNPISELINKSTDLTEYEKQELINYSSYLINKRKN